MILQSISKISFCLLYFLYFDCLSIYSINSIYFRNDDELKKFNFSKEPFGNFNHYDHLMKVDESFFNGDSTNFVETKEIIDRFSVKNKKNNIIDNELKVTTINNYYKKLNKFHGAISLSTNSNNSKSIKRFILAQYYA